MSTRYAGTSDPEWMIQGSPAGQRSQNMSIFDVNADLTTLTTQVMTSVAMPMQTGELVTSVTVKSGATAAGTPTNYWFALYDTAGALLAQSADQLTAPWAANTVMTLALATAQRIPSSGIYYVGLMVKATTPPTLIGANLALAGASAAILSSKILSQTSGSSLTGTAPATIATPTAIATVPFVVLT